LGAAIATTTAENDEVTTKTKRNNEEEANEHERKTKGGKGSTKTDSLFAQGLHLRPTTERHAGSSI
jgi:hypothetical protein